MNSKTVFCALTATVAVMAVQFASTSGTSLLPGVSAALARGNGNGNGNGNGAGHGNGVGHDSGVGHGKGQDQGKGYGKGKTHGKSGINHGAIASELGALNAAHASKSGFTHAAPNSELGRIAAAMQAQAMADEDAAALAGAKAALADALGVDVNSLTADDVTNNIDNTTVTDTTTGVTIGDLAANVQNAQNTLDTQQSTANGLMDAASNKSTDLSAEAEAALGDLYSGKE